MKNNFVEREVVMVKHPKFKNARRGTIMEFGQDGDKILVKINTTGEILTVSSSQLRSIKKPEVHEDMSVEFSYPPLSNSQPPASSTRRTRLSYVTSDYLRKSPVSVESDDNDSKSPISSIKKMSFVEKRNFGEERHENYNLNLIFLAKVLLQLFLILVFALITAFILENSDHTQDFSFTSVTDFDIGKIKMYFSPNRFMLVPSLILLVLHLLSFFRIESFNFPQFSTDNLLPLIFALAISLAGFFFKQPFVSIMSDIPLVFSVSFYSIIIVFFLSKIPAVKSGLPDHMLRTYLQQINILFSFSLIFSQYLLNFPNITEDQSFFLVLILGVLLIRLISIDSYGSSRPPRYSQMMASPFLLTVPIFYALSLKKIRWPIVYYIPFFFLYSSSLILLVEGKLEMIAKTSKDHLFTLILSTILKLSFGFLCGLSPSSIMAWSSLFLEAFLHFFP